MKCDNYKCKEKATEKREVNFPATGLNTPTKTVYHFCKNHAERFDKKNKD